VRASLNPRSFLVVQANDSDLLSLNRFLALSFTGKITPGQGYGRRIWWLEHFNANISIKNLATRICLKPNI